MPTQDGAAMFAYCLDVLLYGILTVQIYIYYLSFPNDRRVTKATVVFVYGVGTLQTVFALRDFYTLFCIPWPQPDPSPFAKTWTWRGFGYMWLTIPLSGASVAAVSQLFYAHRIYVLSKKKLIPGVVIALAVLQLVFGVFVAFTNYHDQIIDDKLIIPFDALAWELSGAICDLIITIFMFRFLSKYIDESLRPMRITLTRIKRLTLESGLITTGVALTYVIVSRASRSAAFIIPGLALSKVYSNSMLALLNNRLRIPGGRNEIASELVIDSSDHEGAAAGISTR